MLDKIQKLQLRKNFPVARAKAGKNFLVARFGCKALTLWTLSAIIDEKTHRRRLAKMANFELGEAAGDTDLGRLSRRRHGRKLTRSEKIGAARERKRGAKQAKQESLAADLFVSQEVYLKHKKVIFQAVELFDEPLRRVADEGVQAHLITQRQINPVAFIELCRRRYNVKHVYAASFHLNLRSVRYFFELIQAGVGVDLVVSRFWPRTKDYVRWVHAISHMSIRFPGIEVGWAYNHAKITVVEAVDGSGKTRRFVLAGSGNLTRNSLIEFYMLDENPELAQFHIDWIRGVIDDPENRNFVNSLAARCMDEDKPGAV